MSKRGHESYLLGVLRWRGHLNWKDIIERVISGFITGSTAGMTFYLMGRLFGS